MKPPFWATVLTICGLSVLCALGTWQVQRLEWKTALLADIQNQSQRGLSQLKISDLTPDNQYLQGEISGRFLFDKEIALQPRTFKGTPGVHVITPLVLDNGQTLLVNRGWAPLGYETQEQETTNKHISVPGMIRTPAKPNIFVPKNTPSANQWYAINIPELAASKTLPDIAPVMLYAIDLTGGSKGISYPDPNALEIHINNNHLQYAFFWFAMAAALLAIYGLRFMRKPS